MRIIILTSVTRGPVSRVLPALCDNPHLEVAKVVLANGHYPTRSRFIRRKLSKAIKIGFLGALNGIRLRAWYADKESEDIRTVCKTRGIELSETPFASCDTTRELFRGANADLGLSLSNGYIPKSVFSIPKYGMLNLHTEILPEFQGALGVIWPIYEGIKETGFTIHQIDKTIDTGDILYQEKYPIKFLPTLRETVEQNIKTARSKIPGAFSYVCENYTTLKASAIKQEKGRDYTTPSFWQFLRMVRQHRSMYQASLAIHST